MQLDFVHDDPLDIRNPTQRLRWRRLKAEQGGAQQSGNRDDPSLSWQASQDGAHAIGAMHLEAEGRFDIVQLLGRKPACSLRRDDPASTREMKRQYASAGIDELRLRMGMRAATVTARIGGAANVDAQMPGLCCGNAAMSVCRHYLADHALSAKRNNEQDRRPLNGSSGEYMTTAETAPLATRPHFHYKQDLLTEIMALVPASLLDVGCGEGQLLRAAKERGIGQSVGLEIETEVVDALVASGLDVRIGRAEQLPFDSRSFDVVVFDYVAHHVEFLGCALSEAARVARRAVLVLDPWFDISVPSQRTAHAIDLWSKRLDRRQGMVHAPSIDAADLAASFEGPGGWQIDCRYRLILQDVSIDDLERRTRPRLDEAYADEGIREKLDALLDRARLHGMTEDGALLFKAVRPPDA